MKFVDGKGKVNRDNKYIDLPPKKAANQSLIKMELVKSDKTYTVLVFEKLI